ncbi:hypothetical protein [Streptomyces sp. OE57]
MNGGPLYGPGARGVLGAAAAASGLTVDGWTIMPFDPTHQFPIGT